MDQSIFPKNLPHTIVRRAFLTPFNAEQIQRRVMGETEGIKALKSSFIESRSEHVFAFQAMGLYQQALFTVIPKNSKSNLLIVDFREGDKRNLTLLLDKLGSDLQPHRLSCPKRSIDGHKVQGYHPDLAHYLVWCAKTPQAQKHMILNSAIESAMGLNFRTFKLLEEAFDQLNAETEHRRNGMPAPINGYFGTFDRALRPWVIKWDQKSLPLEYTLTIGPQGNLADFLANEKPAVPTYRLRLHLHWCEKRECFMIGWITEQRVGRSVKD
jgi:hypothetical protein